MPDGGSDTPDAGAVLGGSLAIEISGLPAGTEASASVTGPGAFQRTVRAADTLSDLAPGSYTVATKAVDTATATFMPEPEIQTLEVSGGEEAHASIVYVQTTGSLTLTLSGVPAGSLAVLSVTGPAGFSAQTSETQTWNKLAPGSYGIAAPDLQQHADLYRASITGAPVQVSAGQSASVDVRYAEIRGTLFPEVFTNGTDGNVLVDGSGVSHLVYSSYSLDPDNRYSVRYGECAQGCGDRANWSFVTLGDHGAYGGGARLALDPEGRPRVIWLNSTTLSTASFVYATCDTACARSASQWQTGSVATADGLTASSRMLRDRYFGLDPSGRPRLAFLTYNGLWFAACGSGCTRSASWSVRNLSTATGFGDLDLAFDAGGNARLAYLSGRTISYAECDATCATARSTSLYAVGSDAQLSFAMKGNVPRLAWYDGSGSNGIGGNATRLIFYAWCDGGCITNTNWKSWDIGAPAGDGASGLSLALGTDGNPRLAFGDGLDTSLSYASCDSGCESVSPSWSTQTVETSSQLMADEPTGSFLTAACGSSVDGNASYQWYVGAHPTLSLDASGQARMTYDAYTLYKCSTIDSVHYGVELVRSAFQDVP